MNGRNKGGVDERIAGNTCPSPASTIPASVHFQGNFRRNIARAPNGERVTVVKGESMLALAALVRDGATSTFDVIYVDGDHAVRPVCRKQSAPSSSGVL